MLASPASTGFAISHPPDQSTAYTFSSVYSLLPLFVAVVPASTMNPVLHAKVNSSEIFPISCPDTERGHSCFDNSPVHLGSKILEEADDYHTSVLKFGVVQECHKVFRGGTPVISVGTLPPSVLYYWQERNLRGEGRELCT